MTIYYNPYSIIVFLSDKIICVKKCLSDFNLNYFTDLFCLLSGILSFRN